MKTLHKIFSYLIIAIGLIHIVFTGQIYDEINFNALWFIAGGISAILIGLINLLMNVRSNPSKSDRLIWFIANLLQVIFGGLAIYVMNDPPTYIIVGVITVLFIASVQLFKSRS